MLSRYWIEQFAAVRDGGMMTSADAAALIDYVEDLRLAVMFLMNDPSPHKWIDVHKVIESGPKEPE